MEQWLWACVRWLHLVALSFWLGSQLFLVLVVRPTLERTVAERRQRTVLTAAFGRYFSPLAWASLAILVVTSWLLGEHRGVVWTALLTAEGSYGRILAIKMGSVALVLALTLVHGRAIGPKLAALAQSSDAIHGQHSTRLVRLSRAISTANLVLTLLIVLLAARLVP